MTNPRDVNIDIVGHDKLDRPTDSAVRKLDRLERKLGDVDKATARSGRASEDLSKKWAKHFETGPLTNKLEKFSGALLKVASASAAGVTGIGLLQPVVAGLLTTLGPATAALGVFGGVFADVFSQVNEASGKNQDLLDKIQLFKEKARVYRQRGDEEGAAKEMKKAAAAAVELRARYNLLDPAIADAVDKTDQLKMVWSDFVDKNTPRTVDALTRALDLLIRTIPKLQPLFDAGADAVERFLGFIERKERDGTIDRFITFLADKAPGALSTVADALGTTWDVLQQGWHYWEQLSDAVYRDVENVRRFVLSMRLTWFTSLAAMYQDSADFLRDTAHGFGMLPGIGEKTKKALLNAAAGLDESARRARQKAGEIQAAINSIHDHKVTVTVNTHYTNTGTPAGTVIPSWYGSSPGGPNGNKMRGAAGSDVQLADPGSRATMPPLAITTGDVSVAVTIPGLAGVLTAMVRTEVGKAMAAQAFRAGSRRAYS